MENQTNISGIYAIIHNATGRRYIGSAVNIHSRWECHKSNLRKNKHTNTHLQRMWNLYGPEAFSFVVIETCPREFLLDREQKHIDEKAELNILPVAGSRLGRKHTLEACEKIRKARIGKSLSPEQKAKLIEGRKNWVISPEERAKISERQKGEKNPWFGKHHTDEHKAILRIANIGENSKTWGRKHTEEELRKMREAWKNRIVPRETIERLRAANIGRKHTPEFKKRISEIKKEYWKNRKIEGA